MSPKARIQTKNMFKIHFVFCEKLSKILRVYIAYLADHK